MSEHILVVEVPPFRMEVVSTATELLSADRLTGGAVSETDLSWTDALRGPLGDPGGEGLVCSDETECFGWCRRVLPGSLRDINFRTACGLSVPKRKPEKPCQINTRGDGAAVFFTSDNQTLAFYLRSDMLWVY